VGAGGFGGSCRICGGAGSALLHGLRDPAGAAPGEWALAQCGNCGLVWLYPPATAADLARAYESYYTHVGPTDARALGGWRAAVLRTEFGYDTARPPANGGGWQPGARLLRRFGLIRDSAGAEVMYLRAHPDGRLLDVGCGSGSYLSLMRGLGWQVTGVEPDAAAVSRADPEIRPFLHVGTLEQAGFDAHSFDAITLHHVIEHVPDPVATLRECGRLLAHGGRLVALTPNSEALGRWFFRRRWLHWDPPRHLHVFTRRSLAEAARLAGLRQPTVRTTARGARWAWRASRSPIRQSRPGRARGVDAIAFQCLEHALLRFGVGEELVLEAGAD
jgi:2-polyprenyl-3-methyl-5-hydroxy-6-metoxy-1,4-benzoquinol methylase